MFIKMRQLILLPLLLLLKPMRSFMLQSSPLTNFPKYQNMIIRQKKDMSRQKKDMSMRMSKNQIEQKSTSPLYLPRTQNQKTYVNYLQDPNIKIVLGVGPAGSGKTLFACNIAVEELRKGNIQKIILTRPVVPVEEELGFLPGTLIKKMDPWTRPLFDILLDFYSQKDIDSMVHGGTIEISPLAYMRGRTFKRAFIIADEMQNSSPNQMVMLTTRIGEQSKMVITGDLYQSDRGPNNGLADFLNKIKIYDLRQEEKDNKDNVKKTNKTSLEKDDVGIKFVEMENQDIQRSAIVSKIVNIYQEPNSTPNPPNPPTPTTPTTPNPTPNPNPPTPNPTPNPPPNPPTPTTPNPTPNPPTPNPTIQKERIKSAIKMLSIDYGNNDAAMIPRSHIPK